MDTSLEIIALNERLDKLSSHGKYSFRRVLDSLVTPLKCLRIVVTVNERPLKYMMMTLKGVVAAKVIPRRLVLFLHITNTCKK